MSDASSPSSSPDERRAAIALSLIANIGTVTHRQLTSRHGSAAAALQIAVSPSDRRGAYAAADRLLERATEQHLGFVMPGDTEYPEQLLDLRDPPPFLWYRGRWSVLRSPVISIVGTRRATSYGLRMTREIASALARAGATIVSGMALGIDAAAHRHALDAGGSTIAVLGTGADVPYPNAHTALHREIGEKGLIVSELPPGAKSGPGSFPRRNRIIAGLASLTIVVEAPLLSGALLTSGHALEIGRDVAAIPGPIDMPQSLGCNELIRDGAHPITSIADVLMLAGLNIPREKQANLTDETEIKVWSALASGAATLDDLCARASLPVSQCLSAVTGLEMRGLVECALTGEVRRR